jgi:hypothetical protein
MFRLVGSSGHFHLRMGPVVESAEAPASLKGEAAELQLLVEAALGQHVNRVTS